MSGKLSRNLGARGRRGANFKSSRVRSEAESHCSFKGIEQYSPELSATPHAGLSWTSIEVLRIFRKAKIGWQVHSSRALRLTILGLTSLRRKCCGACFLGTCSGNEFTTQPCPQIKSSLSGQRI